MIYRRLWGRPDFRSLTFEAKALYCYLRTCPAGGLVGIFRFHPDDAHEDLGMPHAATERALEELEAGGWIRRERRELWIIDAVATTPGISLANPKHRVAIEKALVQVSPVLAEAFRALYGCLPDTQAQTHPDSQPDAYAEGYPNHVDVDVTVNGDGNGDRHQDEKSVGLRVAV